MWISHWWMLLMLAKFGRELLIAPGGPGLPLIIGFWNGAVWGGNERRLGNRSQSDPGNKTLDWRGLLSLRIRQDCSRSFSDFCCIKKIFCFLIQSSDLIFPKWLSQSRNFATFQQNKTYFQGCYHWKGSSIAVMGLLCHVLRVECALVQLHLLLLLPLGESLEEKAS